MSSTPRIQPVTRIRGELRPSAPVEAGVNRFLETPFAPGSMRLYTSAQTVVDQGDYHRHRHDHEMRAIERELSARSLAQRAFVLAGPMKILEGAGGSGRLFFNVQPKDRAALHDIGDKIRGIEGLEEPDTDDLLYVEFARGALARDQAKRRDQVQQAHSLIASAMRHPTATFRMTATGLHVVTKDMMYPVRTDRPPLPLAE